MASTDVLSDLGFTLKRFKMYPYFDIANFILMCISVREDSILYSSTGGASFSRLHPFTSWFASMMLCFAGGILGNFLLGEPLLAPMQSDSLLLIATTIWYLMNYAPFDVIYKLCKFQPIRIVILVLKEIQRTSGVNKAILFALMRFPDSYILILMFGILKGSAANHMKLFQRTICGYWQPNNTDILKPAIVTKASSVASVLFLLHRLDYIHVADEILYAWIALFFLLLRLLAAYHIDPFLPFENLMCSVFMGGVMDSLKRASTAPTNDVSADISKTKKNHTKSKDKPKDE